MGISATIVVDDDFTENDLKVMLAAKDYWVACYNIKEHVRLMYRGKRDISAMDTQQAIDDIWNFINEELSGLPELD